MLRNSLRLTGANHGDVYGYAQTVYRQKVLNLGPGIADIQVAHYHTSHYVTPLETAIIAEKAQKEL